MKYLKLYENFEDIEDICHKYGIYRYDINQDDTVSTLDDVNIQNCNFKKLPLKFRTVAGHFILRNNKNLITLVGCPKMICDVFKCSQNKQLTTLKGGPIDVGSDYWANNNNLMDVYGFPEDHEYYANFTDNPVAEIVYLADRSLSEVKKFINYLNEYEVIQGDKVFELGLDEAYYLTTKHELSLERKNFKNYQLR